MKQSVNEAENDKTKNKIVKHLKRKWKKTKKNRDALRRYI